MPKVQKLDYSRFVDVITQIEFREEIDARDGTKVAIATVSEEDAALFAHRPGFVVLTPKEYSALCGYNAHDAHERVEDAPREYAPRNSPAEDPLDESVKEEGKGRTRARSAPPDPREKGHREGERADAIGAQPPEPPRSGSR